MLEITFVVPCFPALTQPSREGTMKTVRIILVGAAILGSAAGCALPTETPVTATQGAPRFDTGYGMGSGSAVGEPGSQTTPPGSQTTPIGQTSTLESDSTSRSGGYGMGSGS